MWPRNTLEVIQEEFVQGCTRSGVCSCVGCCCAAGKDSHLAKSAFTRKQWRQTWKHKMDEVKAAWCSVENPFHFKHLSRPFCYQGIISGGLGVSWPQTCERLSCVFWKKMTFTIWRIAVKHRTAGTPSLPAFEKNSGLFIRALFTTTFPFLQFN